MNSVTSKDWGRLATFGLGVCAHLSGLVAIIAMLIWWFWDKLPNVPHVTGDGVVLTLVIAVSTPIQVLLLVLFAKRTGQSAAAYLGWVWPGHSHIVFGVICIAAFFIFADVSSWLTGHDIIPAFQNNITQTARAAGWLVWLLLAIVVAAPIGEETLFRGFLFRGWLKSPRDAWPVIGVTSLIFALLHVQYDAFYMTQIFAFGLLLGWLRWASGSTILTIILHGLSNLAGMLETLLRLHY